MPELPEVETIALQLNEVLKGKIVRIVKVYREKNFLGNKEVLIGSEVLKISRRAKTIIFDFENFDEKLIVHLKMTGQLIFLEKIKKTQKLKTDKTQDFEKRIVGGHPTADWVNELPSKHTRVEIGFEDDSKLFFNDMRAFGWMKIISRTQETLPAGRQVKDSRTQDIDVQVIIVTGDRDALQLIDGKRVVVYLPVQNKYAQSVVFDEEKFKEVYGLDPMQIVDLKGLMGDSSDNIPGVKGVGKVTATQLVKDFGSVEEIYKNINSDKIKPRTRQLLLDDKEMGIKSRSLAEIYRKVPLEFDWDKCLLSDYDKAKVVELLTKLDFKSLINRLPEEKFEKDVVDIFV